MLFDVKTQKPVFQVIQQHFAFHCNIFSHIYTYLFLLQTFEIECEHQMLTQNTTRKFVGFSHQQYSVIQITHEKLQESFHQINLGHIRISFFSLFFFLTPLTNHIIIFAGLVQLHKESRNSIFRQKEARQLFGNVLSNLATDEKSNHLNRCV